MLRYALFKQSSLDMNSGAGGSLQTSEHSKTLFRIYWTSMDIYVCECRLDDRFLSLMLTKNFINLLKGIDLTFWNAIITVFYPSSSHYYFVLTLLHAGVCSSPKSPWGRQRREPLERGRRLSGLLGELPKLKPFGFEGSGWYGHPTASRRNDLVFSSQAKFHHSRWQRILWVGGY